MCDESEETKADHEKTGLKFGAKGESSANHEDCSEYQDLERPTWALNLARWRKWWQRKRRNKFDRLPPIRPAKDLIKARCRVCGAVCIVWKDDAAPLCLRCTQRLIRTSLKS